MPPLYPPTASSRAPDSAVEILSHGGKQTDPCAKARMRLGARVERVRIICPTTTSARAGRPPRRS